MNNAHQILIIEDDPEIASLLETSLSAAGYRVYLAASIHQAMVEAQSRQPDLFLLDLGLPDGDGLTLIPRLRAFTKAPILVLSARGREADRIAALDLGGDDFISKPFSSGELHARLRAALRRTHNNEETYTFESVTINFTALTVHRAGQEVHLTPTEFKLLATLVENRGKVLTQRFLLNAVWGPQLIDQAQYLRVYMKQLRQKLEADPARPKFFKTETGIGYRFQTTET
jgi:two-component system KDP operon response regulator KdpE